MADPKDVARLAAAVRMGADALLEAQTIARGMGLPTYLQAPLATAFLKSDAAAAALEQCAAELADPD